MATLMVLVILVWIGLGAFGLNWLTKEPREHADTLIIVGVLIYFGVPMLVVSMVP